MCNNINKYQKQGKLIAFLVLFLFVSVRYSQAQFFDTISYSLKQKPQLDFKVDSRNSFISNRQARIFGVKVGLNFNKKVKIGIGYNWITSDVFRPSDKSFLKYAYLSPYFEYVYYKQDKWWLSIPVQFGLGWARYQYNNNSHTSPTYFLLHYEPAMIGMYEPVRYLAVGGGVGYRLMLIGQKNLDNKLTAPIYIIKVKLYLDRFIRLFL